MSMQECERCTQLKEKYDFPSKWNRKDLNPNVCCWCHGNMLNQKLYRKAKRKKPKYYPILGEKLVRTCKVCGKIKKDYTFPFEGNAEKLDHEVCKKCHKKEQQIINIDIKTYKISEDRKRKHGITNHDFKRMFKKQDGKCAICETQLNLLNCHIDHDHKTNKVRGLLCPMCNTGFGMFYDNIDSLERAIKYIKDSQVVELKQESIWD